MKALSIPEARRLMLSMLDRLEHLETNPLEDRTAPLAGVALDARALADGLNPYALDALAATFDD